MDTEGAALSEPITFLASFPPVQGAIRISGNGDGLRLQLDVPESEVPSAIRLLMLRDKAFRVTVEAEEQG